MPTRAEYIEALQTEHATVRSYPGMAPARRIARARAIEVELDRFGAVPKGPDGKPLTAAARKALYGPETA